KKAARPLARHPPPLPLPATKRRVASLPCPLWTATVLFTITAPGRPPSLTSPSRLSPNSQSTRPGPSTTEQAPSPPTHPFLPANPASPPGAGPALRTVGAGAAGGAALPSDPGRAATAQAVTVTRQTRTTAVLPCHTLPTPSSLARVDGVVDAIWHLQGIGAR